MSLFWWPAARAGRFRFWIQGTNTSKYASISVHRQAAKNKAPVTFRIASTMRPRRVKRLNVMVLLSFRLVDCVGHFAPTHIM